MTIIGEGPYYVESVEYKSNGLKNTWDCIYRIDGKAFMAKNFEIVEYHNIVDWVKEGF